MVIRRNQYDFNAIFSNEMNEIHSFLLVFPKKNDHLYKVLICSFA